MKTSELDQNTTKVYIKKRKSNYKYANTHLSNCSVCVCVMRMCTVYVLREDRENSFWKTFVKVKMEERKEK